MYLSMVEKWNSPISISSSIQTNLRYILSSCCYGLGGSHMLTGLHITMMRETIWTQRSSSSVGSQGGSPTNKHGFSPQVWIWNNCTWNWACYFWYEQRRPDQGNYIRINLGNVDQSNQHNLMKWNNTDVDLRGSEHDWFSDALWDDKICKLWRLSINPGHQLDCLSCTG